jgi:amino acid permease
LYHNILFLVYIKIIIFNEASVLLQDTLKSSPPENRVMKRASLIGILTTTLFYVLCGTLGYAAFGNDAPGNFLTGFGFYEPFWLIDIANVCIAIHLIGAYQVIK